MPLDANPDNEYIKIGDVILLGFTYDYFNSIKEEEKEEEASKLTRIWEKPDYVYKGYVFVSPLNPSQTVSPLGTSKCLPKTPQ